MPIIRSSDTVLTSAVKRAGAGIRSQFHSRQLTAGVHAASLLGQSAGPGSSDSRSDPDLATGPGRWAAGRFTRFGKATLTTTVRSGTALAVRGVKSLYRYRSKAQASGAINQARHSGRRIVRSSKAGRQAGKTGIRLTRVAVRGIAHVIRGVGLGLKAVASLGQLGFLTIVMGLLLLVVVLLPGFAVSTDQDTDSLLGASGVAGFVGDDYPWRTLVRDSRGQATGYYNEMNPHTAYAYGNCTDFVFWRVNRDMGRTDPNNWYWTWGTLTPHGGDGGSWGLPGNMPGWTVVMRTSAARPGDIISYRPGVLGHSAAHGHVGYISKVNPDGSLFIENYGLAQYYTTTESAVLLNPLIAAGAVTIRHSTVLDKYLAAHPQSDVGGTVNGSDIQAVKNMGRRMMAAYGWSSSIEFSCLDRLWMQESGWRWDAENPSSGAYGIPQSLPASKLAAAGSDWKTNPVTQIRWGLAYIKGRYGSPCGAWDHEIAHNWY